MHRQHSSDFRNNLRSFVKTLQQQTGETYAPEYLSQDAYDVIMDEGIERGNGTP